MDSIGSKLLEIRKYLNIQLWLVEKNTAIPEARILEFESNEESPNDDQLARLAHCYGVKVEYLKGELMPVVDGEFQQTILNSKLSEHDQAEMLKFAGYLSVLADEAKATVPA